MIRGQIMSDNKRRNYIDVEAAAKSLAEATERLRKRNIHMGAYLEGESGESVIERVANSPDVPLDDATERYRKFLDKLDARKSSVPPPPVKTR